NIKHADAFPLPAYYAHPIVLDRMIRAIKMGRAYNTDEALQVVKDDLKALNPSVTVTQKEYDEVVVVKPLFALMEYR
ncbi:MAG: ATPase P, partial [Lachnospiraceae bacterium]|nr:ATPase P [Lachnospiraceae bacterium]